ncbi:hypothetical protein BT67DRAFT_442894 [Trichocladium antarcticum]|uniref:Methyltransferase n=1 Tax=Trichocladium antarcticum TaxID=1450529 RepID=A0AAN6ZBZ0_9PEZI|nr:hypothetical protein BT67DRAFT_442894 [Trichocladium antarcticum]
MVAAYNARAANQGLTPAEMYAHQGNICTRDDGDATAAAFASPEFSGFDVAAVGLGFHHFDDPALAARKLAARLKVGGVLVIIDFLPHGKPDPAHAAASTVTHHGFSEAQMRRIYDQAGVGNDFALEEVANVVFNTHTHTHAGSEHTHAHTGSEHTHTGSDHTHTHTGSEHSHPPGHEPEMRRTIFIARGVKA